MSKLSRTSDSNSLRAFHKDETLARNSVTSFDSETDSFLNITFWRESINNFNGLFHTDD